MGITKTIRAIVFLFIVVLALSSTISCTHINDIDYGSSIESDKSSETDDDFYTLSNNDSYKEYGVFSIALRTSYDGKYIYKLKQKQIESAAEYKRVQYNYLYKQQPDFPEEEISVCEDPLCDHTPGSGCPFDGIESIPVVFKGRVYYTTLKTTSDNAGIRTSAEICRFDAKTNKKIVIDRSDRIIILRKDSEEELYYYKDKELDEFVFARECWRIKDDDTSYYVSDCGAPSGTLPDMRYSYADRYQVYSKSVKTDDGYTYYTAIYDAKLDYEHKIFSSTGENALSTRLGVNAVYGKTLLIDRSEQGKDGETRHSYRLLDIETLEEKELFSFAEQKETPLLSLLCYSDKCIVYAPQRTDEKQPMILHLLFPFDGKEETFDLSELVGADLAIDLSFRPIERGAVKLCEFKQGNDLLPVLVDMYEINVQNGAARSLQEK